MRSFRRMRRAWWSLLALLAIFVFCLCAEWVCPCDPKEVVDPATLERYRESAVERTYDVKTARFSVGDGGEMFDFEGPEEVRARCREVVAGGGPFEFPDYRVSVAERSGYRRVFL